MDFQPLQPFDKTDELIRDKISLEHDLLLLTKTTEKLSFIRTVGNFWLQIICIKYHPSTFFTICWKTKHKIKDKVYTTKLYRYLHKFWERYYCSPLKLLHTKIKHFPKLYNPWLSLYCKSIWNPINNINTISQ